MRKYLLVGAALGVASLVTFQARAEQNLLSPVDKIIAIDADFTGTSNYPGAENPPKVIDGNTGTKYLNFAKLYTGFIVTPGSATVKSMTLTTAGDAVERDPASYQLFGTNNAISDVDNGRGVSETWSFIASGALSLPAARNTLGPTVDIPNNASYSSYKLIFPTVKTPGTANSMQIAEVQLYTQAGAGGSAILAAANPIIAIDAQSQSNYPAAENPAALIDGSLASKYLNFGKENSGVIITPAMGGSIVQQILLATANDSPERDPASYKLYGTNEAIDSQDNSSGLDDAWSLISSGAVTMPDARNTQAPPITFSNSTVYTSYMLVFDTVKNGGTANSMQVSELQLVGVPEPTSMFGLVVGGMFLLRRRRA